MTSAYRENSIRRSVEISPVAEKFNTNNAIRAELAALQSSCEHSDKSQPMTEIQTISGRLLKIANSLRDNAGPFHDPSSRLGFNDPACRQKSLETVGAIIKARRHRETYFDPNLFADPAWDILLSLFRAELVQSRTCATNLCIDADVPTTTALRWIKCMADDGLLVRRVDPLDARRVFIELSPKTSRSMAKFIADLSDA